MRLHSEYDRKMSSVFLRQADGIGRKIYLNDTLNEQNFYIEMEVKDPDGALVCEIAMSYEQFVRVLLFSGDVPVTLLKYRDKEGKLTEEKVPPPESAQDSLLKDLHGTIGGLENRIIDMRKDLYELLNSGKPVSKKKLESLFREMKGIEDNYKANIPYVTSEAVKKVGEIQDNAKSQLTIAMNQLIGSDAFKPENFKQMIDGNSEMALPDYTAEPVTDDYELKEREEKNVDDMTNMELGDAIHRYLKVIEKAEDRYLAAHPAQDKNDNRKLLFWSSASGVVGGVSITNISYHGGRKIETEKARRYLKFLKTIKKYEDFKTHYNFERE